MGLPCSPHPTSTQIPGNALSEWSQPSSAPKILFPSHGMGWRLQQGDKAAVACSEDGGCMAFLSPRLLHLGQPQGRPCCGQDQWEPGPPHWAALGPLAPRIPELPMAEHFSPEEVTRDSPKVHCLLLLLQHRLPLRIPPLSCAWMLRGPHITSALLAGLLAGMFWASFGRHLGHTLERASPSQ